VAFLACAGQQKMATLGYSPLPPVLVQADFNAIARMNGGQAPPAPTAQNCKNPYVDGEIPLPGSPVVDGISGGGIGGTGSTSGSGGSTTGGTTAGATTTAAAGATGTTGKSGTSSGKSGASSRAGSAAAAAGLTPELAAQGYTVVNGQVVRRLGSGGPNQFLRANALVAATSSVGSTQALVYIGWALLAMGVILAPPLVAMRITRRRELAAGATTPSTDG